MLLRLRAGQTCMESFKLDLVGEEEEEKEEQEEQEED